MIDNCPNEVQTKLNRRNFAAREPITDRFLETLINNKPGWENRQNICKNHQKDGRGKKPQEGRICKNPLVPLENRTLKPFGVCFVTLVFLPSASLLTAQANR